MMYGMGLEMGRFESWEWESYNLINRNVHKIVLKILLCAASVLKNREIGQIFLQMNSEFHRTEYENLI